LNADRIGAFFNCRDPLVNSGQAILDISAVLLTGVYGNAARIQLFR
jgi:hypothetical protein